MGAVYATTQDVTDLWRALTADETTQATALLSKASAVLRSRMPSIDARLATGTIDVEALATVVAAMVTRVMQNPEGMRSEGGDGYTYTIDSSRSSGALQPTADELASLAPVPPLPESFKVKVKHHHHRHEREAFIFFP